MSQFSSKPVFPVVAQLQAEFDSLSRELQRAARWIADHPADVCFLSMREQARLAEVVPPTMTRLAKALGYESFKTFQGEFRGYVSWNAGDYSARAKRLQAGAKKASKVVAQLERIQETNVETLAALNGDERFVKIAAMLLKAKNVAFLGFRSCHSVALHAQYLYSMLLGRGVLLQDAYGTMAELVDGLEAGSVIFAVGLAPYSRQTVDVVKRAAAKKIAVVAITDSELSPLARNAKERLLFEAASNSFFHSLVAAHALVECVMAEVAAHGGKTVLSRLQAREALLRETGAYWTAEGAK